MRYVIASGSERSINSCREFLGSRDELEFRLGSVRETGWDCDAAVLMSPLAHERYGGVPQVGVAQVLTNRRADGAPEVILATPPRPMAAASHCPSDSEIERRVFGVLNSCMTAYVNCPGCSTDSKVLIHLEAAGMDRRNLDPPLRGIADFLAEADIG
jgi:hypothetical protein